MSLFDAIGAVPHWLIIAAFAGYFFLLCVVSTVVFIGVRAAWDWVAGRHQTVRTRRELRDLECGTCDGLNAREVARLVEASWVIARRD